MPFTQALTLAVSDTSSGSTPGASALVSGGTNGRTVRLYRAPWTNQDVPRSWTQVGTGVVSGGTATITDGAAAFGYYEWMAVQQTAGGDVDAFSTAQYRPVMDDTAQSVWERCVDYCAATVTALALPGLTSDRVQSGWLPANLQNVSPKPPAAWCAPFGAETYPGQLTNTDDVGYPVIVLLTDSIDRETRKHFNRNLLWRQSVARAIRFQAPAGITEVFYSEISPDVVMNPQAWEEGLWASVMLFRFLSREPRGFGA